MIGYGAGAQSWDENATLSGAFERWQDIAALDGATIARYLRHDDVDVVIDASGFGAPQNLIALTRGGCGLCLSWLGNPTSLLAPVYDARIGALPGDWGIAGGWPLPRLQKPETGARAAIQFGADVSLAQLGDDTVAMWSAILRASDSKLVLRTGDASRAAVDWLVARFGAVLATRIDLVTAGRPEEFWACVDVALAPRRGVSPRLAAEAVSCGVPVVAFAAASAAEPYGAFLHGIGLCGVGNDGDFVRRALDLAASRHAPAPDAAALGAAAFARSLDERILHALA